MPATASTALSDARPGAFATCAVEHGLRCSSRDGPFIALSWQRSPSPATPWRPRRRLHTEHNGGPVEDAIRRDRRAGRAVPIIAGERGPAPARFDCDIETVAVSRGTVYGVTATRRPCEGRFTWNSHSHGVQSMGRRLDHGAASCRNGFCGWLIGRRRTPARRVRPPGAGALASTGCHRDETHRGFFRGVNSASVRRGHSILPGETANNEATQVIALGRREADLGESTH